MSNPTTPFSWQMPTATDLVTDLPADFEVFGQAVATSMGDLLGGTTGQILAKASATDMDFSWIANDQGDITGITAGTGITVTSPTGPVPTVAIDTAVTVDKTTAQTLTNKTLTSPALTTPTISTLTTNGDLLYGTGSGVIARQGIGSAGQVLTVTAGIPAWATPTAGDITAVTVTSPITGGGTSGSVDIAIQDASTSQKGSVQLSDSTSTTSSVLAATSTAVKSAYDLASSAFKPLPYITNNYYSPAFNTTRATALYSSGTTFYTPIFIRENRTFNRIAIVTGTTFSGTGSVRLGIYNISSAGVPTTVLLDAGTVAPSAASQINEITISQALTPGYYMLAFNVITNATTTSFLSTNVATFPNSADMGAPTASGNVHVGYTQTVSATSGFATAVSPATSANNPPSILIRA